MAQRGARKGAPKGARSTPRRRRIAARSLRALTQAIFVRHGFATPEARQIANVLLAADLRGIDSHGVARLPLYHRLLSSDQVERAPRIRVLRDAAATALVDGGNGMGMVVGRRAMEICLEKARVNGVAAVTVRNSNHFGIAGYYAMLALRRNAIGICMTNSFPFAAPTYGRERLLGTNPIAFAAPAAGPHPFVLDMATTAVSVGKVQVASFAGRAIPLTWALDRDGRPTSNPADLWQGGGLLPLGSTPDAGSYKGYGLGVMVDILCGALSGANCIASDYWPSPLDGIRPKITNTGHFFAAIRLNAITSPRRFKATVGTILEKLKRSAKQRGQRRVFVAGEKEFEAEQERLANGVPLYPDVLDAMASIGRELGAPARLLAPLARRQRSR